MKRIRKTVPEPDALAVYKETFSAAPAEWTWKKFKKQAARREEVKDRLRSDQRGLCAYCENALISVDESVEHFVSRDVDHARELDWDNLLLCCSGGERPLPEEVGDKDARYDPAGPKSCGHAKLNSSKSILNPLDIPVYPRLVRVKTESGEIVPDDGLCRTAGIAPDVVDLTIDVLGLRAPRLNRARLALTTALLEMLGEQGGAGEPFSEAREAELASQQIPEVGVLPAFFTTIRFFLGNGAEHYLESIHYQG